MKPPPSTDDEENESKSPADCHDLLVIAATMASIQVERDFAVGQTFRTLYDVWVRLGGYVRGKPLRSVRHIKVMLGNRREVRSLETKLAGRTLLQRDDIKNLLHLFLDHWETDPQTGTSRPYRGEDPEALAERIADKIIASSDQPQGRVLRLPVRGRNGPPDQGGSPAASASAMAVADGTLKTRDALIKRYSESDALITVSREKTFTGSGPASIMREFQDLMDELRLVDQSDDRFRALIWIVDLGRRESDLRAQAALHNLDFVGTQFKSFLMTNHAERVARQRWFCERAVVLVGTLRREDIDRFYEEAQLDLPDVPDEHSLVTADRLLINGLPHEWVSVFVDRGFSSPEAESITVHVDRQRRPAQRNADDHDDIDYLLHFPATGDDGVPEVRCVSLPPVGVRFNDTFRMARDVAMMRLGRDFQSDLDVPPIEDLAFLRRQRFAALTASEFCRLTTRLAFDE